MPTYMSRDARKVVDHLATYGIEIELSNGQFEIEVACAHFFPNHINGVIDQVLKGKKSVNKLLRAQERGWDYFDKPVRDFLSKRTSSWQHAQQEGTPIPFAHVAYNIIVTTLLAHDINRIECDTLIYDIPNLTSDRDDILHAVRICKNNNARSINYLYAILERERAKKVADANERDANRIPIWEPGELERVEDHLGISDAWDKKRRAIGIGKIKRPRRS